MLFAFLFILLTAVASIAASFSAFFSVKLYYILGDTPLYPAYAAEERNVIK